MCTTTDPATSAEALGMLEAALGAQQRVLRFLAAQDAAGLPAPAAADQLRALERADAAGAAVRGRLLEVFDSQDGHLAGGQRSTRAWLIHSLRVTRGQAAEHLAVQALARGHRVLHAALAEGWVITKSAMIIPVVSGDIDPGAVDELIALCVGYHQLRTQAAPADRDAPGPADAPGSTTTQDRAASQDAPDAGAAVPAGLTGSTARDADQAAAAAAAVAQALADMEHQILAKILQVVSGPGGAASFLRRHLLGKPLAGPSLPLDVGQTDDIPVHLRRLVALREHR